MKDQQIPDSRVPGFRRRQSSSGSPAAPDRTSGPRNYGNLWSYNQIPYDLRQQYNFDRNDRYYYGDGYVYRVDPRTMLVEQVVSALLR